jgi:multicomponent K+:H+ antiporter subunit E
MTRLVPYPLMSAALVAFWLLINQSVSPGHLVLGAAAGLAGGWALAALGPPKARVRRFAAVPQLFALVFADVVRSNIAVARIVLSLGAREQTSGFVRIPLDLRDPYGLAVLASIITSTPGTLWVSFDPAKGELTIHVLDLIDERHWIRIVKGRYERLLMEIFE